MNERPIHSFSFSEDTNYKAFSLPFYNNRGMDIKQNIKQKVNKTCLYKYM